ncbi:MULTISPECIES: hypothetical protein [Clostridium]|uniref:Lipoprotein n=1 Tax=Clostridium cibarium TaxID=2762247 RepID=A0ABR8PT59_9CLOT|nr:MULTISPECIES: hypothetical protein [Clostridium]MBD7911352.1 hypothetical protein [Clostridium cibarium]
MNFTTRNFFLFLLSFIGLSACFTFLFQRIYISIPIGLFLSICMFYDPKKYEAAKKKFEKKQTSNENIHN